MVTTPLQTILKNDNESALNTLRKGQSIASDALLDISITIELIVEDYLQSGKNKLHINQIIPKETQGEEINLILSAPKPRLKRIYYYSKLGYHLFDKRSSVSSSEKSTWLDKVEPLDIVLTECPPQMRLLIDPLLKTFATNIPMMYSGERTKDAAFVILMKKRRKIKLTVLLIQGRLLRKDCDNIESVFANFKLSRRVVALLTSIDYAKRSTLSRNLKANLDNPARPRMDAHLPTEERSTTSDVASTMLAGDIFASTASSDSNGNKLKQIARYIKRLLMCQDSIHKTIDSPIHRVKLRASGVAQFGREVDMDKHVLVSLSVAKACNAILFRTDYSKLCRTLVPNTKLSTLHALQLNTVGLRYLFFPKFRPIRAQTQDGNYIKNETMAKDNKDSLFATIFDLNKIKQLCKSHGTEFDYRLIITSYHIAHLQATAQVHLQQQ
ncbi:hypothetical protein BCV72DRAFT_311827 [Rhizopus microsporus var. microsporus]|uniref:Uncharacterized protein n=1 Tax=Rhizopus microsporus var. microsporus TaxID=86635 RepID=A0A1X0QYQ1_RHIZD|nr:hypothetical protein BCV72DRAFT_311827 [Rhizopus microsporus var. microsporus]